MIFGIWTLLAASVYWLVDYPALYCAAGLLNYFCCGGLFAIFPGSVTSVFGLTYGPQIYSIILTGSFFASLITVIMTTYILPVTGFGFVFLICFVFQAIGLVFLYFFEETLDEQRLAAYFAL